MRRFTPKEAAAFLGYSVSTLRHWRRGCKTWEPGLGPKFYSIHGRVFYTMDSLVTWMRTFASEDVIDSLITSE